MGKESPKRDETNYTDSQILAQAQIGLNFNHVWQLLYTARMRSVDVTAGTLAGIPTLESRFGRILGDGTTNVLLNRFSIIYDTRDDLTVPSHGMEWIAYAGGAARSGLLNDSLVSEAGVDGRNFWPGAGKTEMGEHGALR